MGRGPPPSPMRPAGGAPAAQRERGPRRASPAFTARPAPRPPASFLYDTFVVAPGPRRCAGCYASFTDSTKTAVGEKRFNKFTSNGVRREGPGGRAAAAGLHAAGARPAGGRPPGSHGAGRAPASPHCPSPTRPPPPPLPFNPQKVLNVLMMNSPGGPKKADDSDHPLKEVMFNFTVNQIRWGAPDHAAGAGVRA
jgi:hypothetical protein